MMKLFDLILFVLAFCFFVIGVHQAIIVGIAESYWIFMFSLMPLFLYGYRKNLSQDKQSQSTKNVKDIKKKSKNG